jgi:hypothetical protein
LPTITAEWSKLSKVSFEIVSSDVGPHGGERRMAWQPLYDGVASFFGFAEQTIAQSVDIRPLRYMANRMHSRFYVGDATEVWKKYGTDWFYFETERGNLTYCGSNAKFMGL